MKTRTTSMIRMTMVIALAALLAMSAVAVFGKSEAKKVTLDGEVLDLYCYMKRVEKGQGSGHAKCARSCIRKGLPIGFLSNGEIYLLIGKEHESAKDIVVEMAGMQSRLTGTLIEHHGVKAIEVEKIEEMKKKS